MTIRECYAVDTLHCGDVRVYTDGVDTHPLCDMHAERDGFKSQESVEDFLTRITRTL